MPKLFSILLALLLVVGVAAPASAQILYTEGAPPSAPPLGPRIGLGGGAFVYNGPDIINPVGGEAQFDVTQTSPMVSLYGIIPFADQVALRAHAGLANLGVEAEGISYAQNPFLVSELLILEGHLMGYLASPRTSRVAPYAYAGFGTILALGDDEGSDVSSSQLVVPLGVGVEFGITRNVSLFLDAGYRLPVSDGGDTFGFATAGASLGPDTGHEHDKCKDNPDLPECEPNGGDADLRFDAFALSGGLLFGFGGAPPVAVIPPPEVIVERETVIVEVEPPPVEVEPVCTLVELNSVYFDVGSALLSREARGRLDENVESLLENEYCCVLIDAYVDSTEDDRYGIRLAERRARAVYQYYLDRGISRDRIQIRERGVAMPPCDKEDPGEGCRLNRRVDSIPLDCERFEEMMFRD